MFPKSRSVLVVDPTWVEEELSSCLSDPISSCLSDPRSKTLSDSRSSSLSEPRSSLGLLVFKIPFTGKQGRKTVYQQKNWSVLFLILNFEHKIQKIIYLLDYKMFLQKPSPCQWRIHDFPNCTPTPEGCANLLYGKIFPENCMKMKAI